MRYRYMAPGLGLFMKAGEIAARLSASKSGSRFLLEKYFNTLVLRRPNAEMNSLGYNFGSGRHAPVNFISHSVK